MIYPEGIPEIERHLTLMKFLGLKTKGNHLELPILTQEEEACNFLKRKYQLKTKEYVIVHAGARDTKRWWSPENFALVADSIAHRGYKVVLTGTESEKKTVRAVEDCMEFPSINLAGKTELGTIAALVRDAKMVLSNDTGISHIAAAVETPSVVIFLASDPKRWAPLNKNLHHIILPQESSNTKLVLMKAERILMDEENEEEFELKIRVD
jgi:ADP-heptose:LPS heptosyltransferase